MKILNYGSLNFDHVYETDHFVEPKETLSSISYRRGFGGKGLNQSIALAKAGMEVYHAGKVGFDGQPFIDYLNQYGVHTEYLMQDETIPTGHAIIEVCHGENRILLHGGANQSITKEDIDKTLVPFESGDLLLIQNEISSLPYLIQKAHEKGMCIAFNTAPMNEQVFQCPLNLIDFFIVNEIEAKGLAKTNDDSYADIIHALRAQYPSQKIIFTCGKDGAYYIEGNTLLYEPSLSVPVKDTTAAGDTFTGYFLASYFRGKDMKECLRIATKASSITIQHVGAADSIPSLNDLLY